MEYLEDWEVMGNINTTEEGNDLREAMEMTEEDRLLNKLETMEVIKDVVTSTVSSYFRA